MKVKIHRINKDNPLPSQAHSGDAGWDVYAAEDVTFVPEQIKLVPLGVIAQAPKGYHFKLCIRSSWGKKGFLQPNAPGIIDHLFSGPKDEIKLMLRAPSENIFMSNRWCETPKAKDGYFTGGFNYVTTIQKGDRIGQLILEKNNDIEWEEQDNIDFAGDSRGGFGSSGA